jgi:hypothetical protein
VTETLAGWRLYVEDGWAIADSPDGRVRLSVRPDGEIRFVWGHSISLPSDLLRRLLAYADVRRAGHTNAPLVVLHRWRCAACGVEAGGAHHVDLWPFARQPPAPSLPDGWHVCDGHALCAQHPPHWHTDPQA